MTLNQFDNRIFFAKIPKMFATKFRDWLTFWSFDDD